VLGGRRLGGGRLGGGRPGGGFPLWLDEPMYESAMRANGEGGGLIQAAQIEKIEESGIQLRPPGDEMPPPAMVATQWSLLDLNCFACAHQNLRRRTLLLSRPVYPGRVDACQHITANRERKFLPEIPV